MCLRVVIIHRHFTYMCKNSRQSLDISVLPCYFGKQHEGSKNRKEGHTSEKSWQRSKDVNEWSGSWNDAMYAGLRWMTRDIRIYCLWISEWRCRREMWRCTFMSGERKKIRADREGQPCLLWDGLLAQAGFLRREGVLHDGVRECDRKRKSRDRIWRREDGSIDHHDRPLPRNAFDFHTKAVPRTTAMKLVVEEMTGKRRVKGEH